MDSDRVRGGGRRGNSYTGGRSGSYSHGRVVGNRQVWKAKSPASLSEQSGQERTDSSHVGVSEQEKRSSDSAASNTVNLNCTSACKDTCSSNESFPKHRQFEGKKDQTNGKKIGDGIWKPKSPDCFSEKSEYDSAHSSHIVTSELMKKSSELVISSEELKSSCKDTCLSTESFGKHGLVEDRHVEGKRDCDLSESLYKASIPCPIEVSGQSVKSDTNINSPKNPTGNSNTEQSNLVAPFDICLKKSGPPVLNPSIYAKNKERRKERNRSLEGAKGSQLRPGMVLLKNYLSCDEQVKILKKCRDLGLGPGGFYQPGYSDQAQLHLKMMCLGKNWNPETNRYESRRSTDGAIPPIIPDEFNQLVKRTIEDSHAVIREDHIASRVETILPFMSPDICIVNFYSKTGKLGLHKDRDESQESLRKGLPVVSFSIGDSAKFAYSDIYGVKAAEVVLESGDALIFGGKSRHIFHGVTAIIPDTAPRALLEETNLLPGRLNLTFRQY